MRALSASAPRSRGRAALAPHGWFVRCDQLSFASRLTLEPSLILDELKPGQHATVAALRLAGAAVDAAVLQRLGELGFLPGEPVRLLRRGPGGREPLAVQVGDTMFALRRAEAACIEVTPITEVGP
ncbi:FeoA family protein [Methylibium petroleiphilum]|uniref:FeoA family protein n=1 Tax=Methylibium petroleiphilum TaxID=105560 RepID=UPI0023565E79|nr:FeoA family protein [Methylibium petroleiphilum]